MTDLEKDKILLLAHSIEKMARELQSIKRLLKEMADASQTETKTETQNSNLTFEKRTMRDCYNCKRYETEGECIECHYEPKDEPVDWKDQMYTEAVETMSCQECKWYREDLPCRPYIVGLECKYEPKTEQTEREGE